MNLNTNFKQLKYLKIATVILLLGIAAPTSFASVTYYEGNLGTYNFDFPIIWPSPTFCLGTNPCDGFWTQSAFPSLAIGDNVSLTSSSSFGFYLGNTISGNLLLSLSPYFRTNTTPTQDELLINVMDRTSTISTSDFGNATFSAISGNDYYVLLTGIPRSGLTYNLQVSQVPLPASWLLLLSGLMFFRQFSSKRKI